MGQKAKHSERAHGCIPHPTDPYAIHILSTHLSPSPPPQAFLPFSAVSHDDQSLDSLAFVLLTHPCHVRTDAEGRRWSARGVDHGDSPVGVRWGGKGGRAACPGRRPPLEITCAVRAVAGPTAYGALSFWTWRQMVRRGLAAATIRDLGSRLKAGGHPAASGWLREFSFYYHGWARTTTTAALDSP
jgi:hypothetical protein